MCLRRLSLASILLLLLSPSFLDYSHAKSYTYLTYSQIHYRLTQLASAHPNLIRLYSAQDRFSLPYVGNCSEQTSESAKPKPAPCTIWIVELTNFQTIESDPSRPEVLVSGELHGNEVIGPHVVLAYIEYMAANYNSSPFIKRMVDTRVVTLVPMTNAIGFHNNEREERQGGVKFDPNRDFGFDQQPTKCMQTVAARVLNELFRVHIYRILVTFHGGTNVIGYEWGDTSHCDGNVCKPAPDMKIMHALAERMASNAGSAGTYEAAYEIGDMGGTVYSVNGGLEDWAYGASWAKEGTPCRPSTLGGYPVEHTRIERTTKRCVTYLVETARDKKPMEHSLGTDDAILERGGTGDGHIPRNIRLLLSVVDAAEPYIIVGDEITNGEAGRPVVSWSVSGAFIVDGSVVQWSTMNGTHTGQSSVLNGTAGLTAAGGASMQYKQELPIDLPSQSIPLYIRIAAVVDRPFMAQPNGSVPDVSPQSHLMGSRGSNQWNFRVGHRQLEGRHVFFSSTFKVTKTESAGFARQQTESRWGTQRGSGILVAVPEKELLDAILLHSGNGYQGSIIPTASGVPVLIMILTAVIGCAGVIAVAIVLLMCVRGKQRRQQRKGVPPFSLDDADDEEASRALTSHVAEDSEEEEVISASDVRSQNVTSMV